MASGSLDIRVRPLRIAFLVDPSIAKDLYRAIELTTLLWGGGYNPIIPAYRRLPYSWDNKQLTPSKLISGYLDAFDPDFVVPIGACAERNFDIAEREFVKEEDFLGKYHECLIPAYGVGSLELLYDFRDEELKYSRYDDLKLVIPDLPKAYRTFLASVFGAVTPELDALIADEFSSVPNCERVKPTIEGFIELLGENRYYPRHLTAWKLDNSGLNETVIFLCDARKAIDIIDYWNLRASGRLVLPIPIQVSDHEIIKQAAEAFIEQYYQPYRHNPDFFHSVTVQKSRSISEDDINNFCLSLDIEDAIGLGKRKYSIRNSYPRFWDAWARENAEGECLLPYAHEENHQISSELDRLDIRSSNPKLKLFDIYSGLPRFANEFHFKFFGSSEPMAEVIPEGNRGLASCIGGFGFNNWRFSRSGIVFFAHNKDDLVFMEPPRAEPVMIKWLKEKGWDAALSPPGRIATQLYKKAGGLTGASWLTHKKIIQLLGKLEKDSGLSWPAVIGYLKKVKDDRVLGFEPEQLLKRLIDSDALRLGAKIQCSNCARFNWYELNYLEYKLTCRFCLSEFSPPLTSPKDIDWSYRSYGPFAASTAQGSFSVLLTLMFFGQDFGRGVTPLFSYTAKKDGKILESDLTCLYKSSIWNNSHTDVIHVECKSFNCFESEDVKRMADLGQEFPGSVIVFSTLKDQLSSEEIEKISELTLIERNKRQAGEIYNPIIVLTGIELFSIGGVTRCWVGRDGLYEKFNKHSHEYLKLEVLADATQQLYLGMDSFFDWVAKKTT